MIQSILVIDDSDVDNYITTQLLEQVKLSEKVEVRLSAPDALRYLAELQLNKKSFPGIILLDINMPEMSGFEFLDVFSAFPETIRKSCCIIILTSSNNPADKSRAMETGLVMDYFVKPLTKDKVQKMAEHYDTVCKRNGK